MQKVESAQEICPKPPPASSGWFDHLLPSNVSTEPLELPGPAKSERVAAQKPSLVHDTLFITDVRDPKLYTAGTSAPMNRLAVGWHPQSSKGSVRAAQNTGDPHEIWEPSCSVGGFWQPSTIHRAGLQVVPLKKNTSPWRSVAAQKEPLAQETDVSWPSGSMTSGVDHDLPLNVLTPPSDCPTPVVHPTAIQKSGLGQDRVNGSHEAEALGKGSGAVKATPRKYSTRPNSSSAAQKDALGHDMLTSGESESIVLAGNQELPV